MGGKGSQFLISVSASLSLMAFHEVSSEAREPYASCVGTESASLLIHPDRSGSRKLLNSAVGEC